MMTRNAIEQSPRTNGIRVSLYAGLLSFATRLSVNDNIAVPTCEPTNAMIPAHTQVPHQLRDVAANSISPQADATTYAASEIAIAM